MRFLVAKNQDFLFRKIDLNFKSVGPTSRDKDKPRFFLGKT